MKRYYYEAKIGETICGYIYADSEKEAEILLLQKNMGEIIDSREVEIAKVTSVELSEEVDSNDKVILYSTGCPKCKILEAKLKEKHIDFEEFTDKDEMIAMGFKEVPWLKIDGKLLNFAEAVKWLNSNGGNN